MDELSLMTVPELAAKAEAECANIVRAKDAAAEAMRHMEEMANRGEINAGLIYSGMATDNFNEAGVHKHNLERLRLVLRNKLNGDEPTWITAYTESTSADQCTNAHTQYGEWAEAQKQKPTDAPTKKKGVPPHRTPQK